MRFTSPAFAGLERLVRKRILGWDSPNGLAYAHAEKGDVTCAHPIPTPALTAIKSRPVRTASVQWLIR
jgi:hypothetical protein